MAPFASNLSVNVSVYTLCIISLDRYHVIMHPFKEKLSKSHCVIILIAVWIVSFGLSFFRFTNFHVYLNSDSNIFECAPKSIEYHSYETILLVFTQYIIPFLIISITYFRIAYHLKFDRSPNIANISQTNNKNKVNHIVCVQFKIYIGFYLISIF
jgi:hypothetical protein